MEDVEARDHAREDRDQSAPKTVPQMYMPITPRPSGLSRPYFSPMMATLGSRSIE